MARKPSGKNMLDGEMPGFLEEPEEEEMPPDTGDSELEESGCLTSEELRFLVGMIDQLSKRGSFYPSEFVDVGLMYNRLKSLQDDQPCKNC